MQGAALPGKRQATAMPEETARQLQCRKDAGSCSACRNRQIAALPGKGQATAVLAKTGK